MAVLATGSDDGEIRIWNVEQAVLKWNLSDPMQGGSTSFEDKSVEKLAFLNGSGVLVSCGGDGYLRFWAAFEHKDQLLHRQEANHRPGEAVLSLASSRDGDQIVTADSGGYFSANEWAKSKAGLAAATRGGASRRFA
jgi:WD40 repeat protein